MAKEDEFWEGQATYVLVAVTYPLLLVIGTFGNVLTYHILHRTTLGDRSAANWLFKCLAVMCLSCLWMGLPRHWLRTVYDYDLRKSHFLICKSHRFLLYCVMDITAWVIVFVSIDRLIAVFAPFRANSICTVRNAKIAFLSLCVFFAAFNIHIFLVYGRETVKRVIPAAPGVVPDDGSGVPHEYVKWVITSECKEFHDNAELSFYNNKIHPYLSFAMYVIGPFCLMLTSSVLISRKLAANRAMIPAEPEPPMLIKRNQARPSSVSPQQESANEADGLLSEKRQSGSNPGQAALRDNRMNSGALKKLQGHKTEQEDEVNLERTTTRLTIAASIEFVLTATPAFIFDIIEPFLQQANVFSSPRGQARFQLIYTSVRLLLFSNFALHFFLFCFTVGRFRKEFKKVLKVWQSVIMIEQRVPQPAEPDDHMQLQPCYSNNSNNCYTQSPPAIPNNIAPTISSDYIMLQQQPVEEKTVVPQQEPVLTLAAPPPPPVAKTECPPTVMAIEECPPPVMLKEECPPPPPYTPSPATFKKHANLSDLLNDLDECFV